MRRSGTMEITAVALEPIHHGAGTKGNTQILREQPIVLPDGRRASTPFISGNSLKHAIRASGAFYALQAMGVDDGALSKPVVDLLFSGGHLLKGGAAVNLERARKLEALFPILGVCGYSAGNTMQASALRVGHLHMLCTENRWRAPERMQTHAHAGLLAGHFRDEEFGTRHEASRDRRVAGLLAGEAQQALVVAKSKALAEKHPDKGDSSQMIYDFQVIKPGATFWGRIDFTELAPLELDALKSALATWCAGADDDGFLFRVGAKNSIGFGLMRWTLQGAFRVDAPRFEATEALAPSDGGFEAYRQHLVDHRDEILDALAEAAG